MPPTKRSASSMSEKSTASASKKVSKEEKQRKAAEASARAKAWAQARKAKKAAKSAGGETATIRTRVATSSSSSSSGVKRPNARVSSTPSRSSRRSTATGKRKAKQESSDSEQENDEDEHVGKNEEEEEDIIVEKPKARPKKRRRVLERDASKEEQTVVGKKSERNTDKKVASSRKTKAPESVRKSKVKSTKQVEKEVPISSEVTTTGVSNNTTSSSSSAAISTSVESHVPALPVQSPTASMAVPPVPPPIPAEAPVSYAPYSPAPNSIAPVATTATTPAPSTGPTATYYPSPAIQPYGYPIMQQLPNGGTVLVPPPGSMHVPTPGPPVMAPIQGSQVPSTVVETIDNVTDAKSEGTVNNETIKIHKETEDTLLETKVESKSTLVAKFKSTGCWALAIFLLSTTLGITILSQMPTSSNMMKNPVPDSSIGSSAVTEGNTCFTNAGIEALDSKPEILCENPVPCPKYGRCAMGQLVDCKLNGGLTFAENESYFVTSSNMDSCVLSKVAVQDLMKIHKTLIDLTCDYTCGGFLGLWTSCQLPSSQIYKGAEDSDIQFSLKNVAELMGMTVEHILTLEQHMEDGSNIVVKKLASQDEDVDGITDYSIGLTPDFVQMELPVSFPCWTRIVLWDLLKTVVRLMIGTLKFTSYLMWSIASAHPLFTLAAMLVISLVNWVKQRRYSVIQRREFVIEIQNTAYDKLVMDLDGGGDGYAALHLRDEIGHEMYPQRGKDRDDFLTNVWPRVAKAVRTDNRVTKSRKHVGGKTLEWWEWVSGASKISRKNAMGSKKEN